MDLFLPQTKELKELANYLGLKPEDLIKKIEYGFSKREEKLDPQNDAGKPFFDVLDSMGVKVSVFACLYLRRSDSFINNILSGLFFKNSLEDCPECGCETTTEYDWNDKGRGTETKICSNCGDVGYEATDWHKQKKGLDY